MFIESCARTDRGLVRDKNEDSLLHRPDRRLFAVADGMGGHVAGEVASAIAIRTIEDRVFEGVSAQELVAAVIAANQSILMAAMESPELQGMGTTLTVLSLRESEAIWAHVGDSRLYVHRDGEFRQVTRDQTWVQQQVDAGSLMPDQARVHPYSSILIQALGTSDDVQPDSGTIPFYPGDRFLLCSDGLTGLVSDAEIAAVLSRESTCEEATRELIDRANQLGGKDNITVVVVEVQSAQQRDP